MSREEVKATRVTCDGCGSVTLIEADDELPYGWHGNHMNIGDWGGTGGSWYACKRGCILKAIDQSEDQ